MVDCLHDVVSPSHEVGAWCLACHEFVPARRPSYLQDARKPGEKWRHDDDGHWFIMVPRPTPPHDPTECNNFQCPACMQLVLLRELLREAYEARDEPLWRQKAETLLDSEVYGEVVPPREPRRGSSE